MAKNYELPEKHRQALEHCFRIAGTKGGRARRAIRLLEISAASCARTIQDDGPRSLYQLSWLDERVALASELHWDLFDNCDESLDKIFCKGIGMHLGKDRKGFGSIARAAVWSAESALEPLVFGGEIAVDIARERFLESEQVGDQAVKSLARTVGIIWFGTTGRELPLPSRDCCRDECWIMGGGPLRISLDSIGVDIGVGTLRYLSVLSRCNVLATKVLTRVD